VKNAGAKKYTVKYNHISPEVQNYGAWLLLKFAFGIMKQIWSSDVVILMEWI
jgi:hypothetical protein